MNSYFEIHGLIIDGSVEILTMPNHVKRLPSPTAGVRRRTPDRRTDPSGQQGNQQSLLEHVYRTGSYPIREFRELPGPIRFGLLRNPLAFAAWGVLKQLEVIEMHYEYVKS